MKRAGAPRSGGARAFALVLLALGALPVLGDDAVPGRLAAARLRAGYVALRDDPAHGQFHRPLYMNSSEGANGVSGEIYALVDHPFAAAAAALGKPSQWCDILILHLNTKHCSPSLDSRGPVLQVSIGKKHDQPIGEAFRVVFGYRIAARTANYLQVRLDADEGPLGTRDYRIVLEAAPSEGSQTLVRLSYAYSYGVVGRLAIQAYLGTMGRDKVGFTVVGREADGRPRYIGGTRGVVERNTMRYYLAVESFLGSLSAPTEERIEKSLRDWFAAAERYPRQLHEMEQGEYLAMKRREYSRQQAAPPLPPTERPAGGAR